MEKLPTEGDDMENIKNEVQFLPDTTESASQSVKSEVTSTPTKIPTAVYMRVSTDKQEFDRQIDGFNNWFKQNSADHYRIEGGIYQEKKSGGGGVVRKKLNQMMNDAKANKFQKVVFWDVSRLGRNTLECLEKIQELWKCGVKCHFVSINQTWDPSDHMSKLMCGLMLQFSEFERDQLKIRTMEGIVAKNAKLNIYAKTKGLPEMRVGIAGMLEEWISDPYKRDGKKGLVVVKSPKKAKLFEQIWRSPDVKNAYEQIGDRIRLPINPKCAQKCDLSQNRELSNAQVDRLHMLGKKKCFCHKKPSRKTIHKVRVSLGLPVRNENSFKRRDTDTDFDDLSFGFMTPVSESHFPCGKRRPVDGGYQKNGKIIMKGGAKA